MCGMLVPGLSWAKSQSRLLATGSPSLEGCSSFCSSCCLPMNRCLSLSARLSTFDFHSLTHSFVTPSLHSSIPPPFLPRPISSYPVSTWDLCLCPFALPPERTPHHQNTTPAGSRLSWLVIDYPTRPQPSKLGGLTLVAFPPIRHTLTYSVPTSIYTSIVGNPIHPIPTYLARPSSSRLSSASLHPNLKSPALCLTRPTSELDLLPAQSPPPFLLRRQICLCPTSAVIL